MSFAAVHCATIALDGEKGKEGREMGRDEGECIPCVHDLRQRGRECHPPAAGGVVELKVKEEGRTGEMRKKFLLNGAWDARTDWDGGAVRSQGAGLAEGWFFWAGCGLTKSLLEGI